MGQRAQTVKKRPGEERRFAAPAMSAESNPLCHWGMLGDLADLVVEDPRREAWFAVDNLSSQWVTAWPTAKHRLTAQEFPEVASSYLGTMSPIVRPFAGQTIPCGHRPRVCDPYGHELGLAALPFDGQTLCHDGCGQAIFDMLREARLHYIAEPRDMFAMGCARAYLRRKWPSAWSAAGQQ